jgi:hypothetical protein
MTLRVVSEGIRGAALRDPYAHVELLYQNQMPDSYSEIIWTIIISEFLTPLNAINSRNYPNFAAIS